MQVACCEMLKNLTAGNSPGCWEYTKEYGWCIPGCCGGGCFVAMELLFCPYCGQRLPQESRTSVINNSGCLVRN